MRTIAQAVKRHWFLLTILLVLAAWLRSYKLNTPLADWHSFRQADTASVTRQFVKGRHPIWEPHYQDLSNIQSGEENPQGYRMVEFPIINYLIAQALIAFPSWDLVVVSRLVSIAFSLISLVSLYGLTYILSRRRSLAFLTGFFWAVLPFSVFYSRVILPEPAMLGCQLLSLWFFVLWLEEASKTRAKSWVYYLVSLIALALSLLIKPTAIFIAPVYLVLSLSYLGFGALFSPWLWTYALIGVAPLIAWRRWILNYPTGIPASDWLLNGNGIRLRPAWWRWLFAERLGKIILGYWGAVLLFLGLGGKLKTAYYRRRHFIWFTLTWAASMCLYLIVFASGNVQHDYYQTLLIPVISLLLARGLFWLLTTSHVAVRKIIAIPLGLSVVALMLFFSWWEVRGFYQINNPAIVEAGRRLDQIAPADAQVIAPYMGDTAFLFQTNRQGWPIHGSIEQRIKQGADYYVSVARDDETKELMEKYPVIVDETDFVIIQLNQD